MKKRAKQVQIMIDSANDYLMKNHVISVYENFAYVFMGCLIKADVYNGFNTYTKDGKLSGGDESTTDYIQFL